MNELSTHEVLVRARALIECEGLWCQDDYERYGKHCALGALKVAQGLDANAAPDDSRLGYAELQTAMGTKPHRFNDHHSHAEVLAAFDKAIAATAPEPDTSFLNEVRVEEPVAS